jgi:phospholipid/cholesterol/gamma-HCH transport system ATP-binding protein
MVELKNISKSFNNTKVLNNLNFQLLDNEVHSVIGQSGAGKTVLIKIIIGLMKPESGRVIVNDEDITDYTEEQLNEKVRMNIGIVYQNGALWDSMTIGENLRLVLKLKKSFSEEEIDRKVKDSLEMVDLPHLENKYPDELSGGMKKRIAIARAIILKPEYIIYDEPTTGLDPVLINTIDNLILKLNKEQNITSLVISHNLKSAETISNRVSMIYNGEIIQTCNSEDLWDQDNDAFNKFIHGDVDFQ